MTLAAMLAIGVGTAYARGGMGGGGNGSGGGMGAGGGMGGASMQGGQGMQGQGGMRLPADFQPATQQQADAAAADYLANNMKGYDVVSSETVEGKRFTGYTYRVEDATGNKFNIVVNARGIVRGPFPVQD